MTIDIFTLPILAGLSGVGLYLIAYALLQLRFISGIGYLYPVLNALAALGVMISLFQEFNLASLLIQISFIAISAYGILRLFYVKNQITFTGNDESLLNNKLPNLSNDIAKQFLSAGEWLDVPDGATLCKEGEQISHLYYVSNGECSVLSKNQIVGRCGAGDFVGEITCFNGEPATGTVKSETDVKLFRITIKDLHRLCAKHPALRFEIENGIADNLRSKIARTNGYPLPDPVNDNRGIELKSKAIGAT